jgi:hypothetical protein
MARKIGNTDKESGVCEQAITALKHLFQLMKKHHINLEIMNLRHDTRFEGKPVPYILRSEELVDVQAERGRATFLSDTAIFRIYKKEHDSFLDKMKELLNWAQAQIQFNSIEGAVGVISAPNTLEFFSAPKPA